MRYRSRVLAMLAALAMAASTLLTSTAVAATDRRQPKSDDCFAKVKSGGAPQYQYWNDGGGDNNRRWGYQEVGTWPGGTCLPKWTSHFNGRFTYQAGQKRFIYTGMPWNEKEYFYALGKLSTDYRFNSKDIIWQ